MLKSPFRIAGAGSLDFLLATRGGPRAPPRFHFGAAGGLGQVARRGNLDSHIMGAQNKSWNFGFKFHKVHDRFVDFELCFRKLRVIFLLWLCRGARVRGRVGHTGGARAPPRGAPE